MKPMLRRWVMGAALAAFAVATISPAAQAGHRRYKGVPSYCAPPVRYYNPPRRVLYYERHSDAAPLFAGLIGGFVLGSALAHASSPTHYYWDPYCHERFVSLSIYRSHFRYHHHPRVVRVISIDSGDCIDTYRWNDGDWRSDDRAWERDGGWDRDGDWDD